MTICTHSFVKGFNSSFAQFSDKIGGFFFLRLGQQALRRLVKTMMMLMMKENKYVITLQIQILSGLVKAKMGRCCVVGRRRCWWKPLWIALGRVGHREPLVPLPLQHKLPLLHQTYILHRFEFCSHCSTIGRNINGVWIVFDINFIFLILKIKRNVEF